MNAIWEIALDHFGSCAQSCHLYSQSLYFIFISVSNFAFASSVLRSSKCDEMVPSFYFGSPYFGCRLHKNQHRVHLIIIQEAICTFHQLGERTKLDINLIFIFLPNLALARDHKLSLAAPNLMPNQLHFQHLLRSCSRANRHERKRRIDTLLGRTIAMWSNCKKCPWLFCAFSFNEICRFLQQTTEWTKITDHAEYRSCWDPERDHFQFSFFHLFYLHFFHIRRRLYKSFDAWPRAMKTLHCYYLCIVFKSTLAL